MTDDETSALITPEGARIGWTPVPDPTKLTTDAVNLATTQTRRELATLREIIEARLDAMDKATDLRLGHIIATPDVFRLEIREAIAHLKALHEERFSAIQQQFTERDVRGEQEKKASKEALDAALLAQKESVSQQNDANTTAAAKTELNFTKQNDQTAVLIATLEKSLSDRLTELKERIDRGEGQGQGANNARIEYRDETRTHTATNGFYVAVAAACIGVGAIVVSVILALALHH